MAAFDHFRNMYDVALNPSLLGTLIRDHLPNEKHPFSNTSELSRVVTLVKTHSLLSESVNDSTDPKLIEAWKSAVTSWVDRIFALLSSSTPDKCWAGISLLGVTCEECSSERFIESYSVWFHKLLSFLQSAADSHFLRVASCASISDLLARLSGFPQFKKDGSSCAVKVIQPVLKMIHDDNSEEIWEAAVHLICTIITSFPFSIQRHYDSVESAIALKLLSGGCSNDMLKKLAYCLALLPKSRGDEESWFVMLQKVLLLINDQLNLAFQGLEEDTIHNEVVRLLVPPGKHPPPPLGGYILAEEVSNKATRRSEQSLMCNASTLIFGSCMMLKNSYPMKVHVPVRPLLALVERILMVNGSLPETSLPFMTAKQQENICSELPVLHMSSLELLMAIVQAMGSQLLPHAAFVVRIITKYFKTCMLPELRTKVYSVIRSLFISIGLGIALCLANEVFNNAFADLSIIESKNGGTLNDSNSNSSTGALRRPSHRKRKHSSTTGSLQERDEGGGLVVEVPKNHPLAPISLRIAALEALESLVTVAGSLRSEQWRSKVDSLLIVIARDSFKEGSASEEICMFQQEPAATATDLQLAALRALLASFLSYARTRPPYLAQGLELFCRGKQKTGTKLAEFCTHALLTLELLIHPKALPLVNHIEAQSNLQDEYVVQNKRFLFGLPQVAPRDFDDDLFAKWLETGKETVESLARNTKSSQEPLEVQERTGTAICADAEMRPVEDETAFTSDQPRESVEQFQEPISSTINIAVAEARDSAATDTLSERIVSDSNMHQNEASQMESGQGKSVNKDFESASQSTSSLQRTSDTNTEFAFKLDYGPSLVDDDFPEIVDADPDSDSDSDSE